ncbi:hypothetical protein ACFV8Z_16280 [Streptomyces sp. NPDC059837]|uniref:hypothetical protein n=1 Tax=Streptomyces sp. NPDC059837 TaxID=3346968 RepID=UPI00364D1557
MTNADRAAALLGWIRRRPRGARLDAGDQWCELLIHTATPEIGKQWTDTGEIHEERDLKGRAEGETRSAPGHPATAHRGQAAQAR